MSFMSQTRCNALVSGTSLPCSRNEIHGQWFDGESIHRVIDSLLPDAVCVKTCAPWRLLRIRLLPSLMSQDRPAFVSAT